MNKPGYKHTPVGWIPEDWEVCLIGDLILKLRSGVSVNGEDRPAGPNEYGVLKVSSVSYGFFDENENKAILHMEIKRARQNPTAGTIVVSRANTPELVGASVYVFKTNTNLFLSDKLWQLETKSEKSDSLWLSHLLSMKQIRDTIGDRATGSSKSMRNISQEAFFSIEIALPPILVQRRTAAILSTWDAAIAKEQQLINALQTRHHALMQQLLIGKKRLKGLKEEWKRVLIENIAKEISIKNKTNKDIIVLSCTKYDGLVPSLEYFGRKIFADDLTTYKIVPREYFAYATNHIEEGSIGYQDKFDEGLISPMYTVFKTNSLIVNNFFLFRLLKTHRYILEYRRRMEGSIDRRGGLHWDEFSKIKLSLPTFEEQLAIVNILRTSEKEIQTHRRHLGVCNNKKRV